MSWSAPQNVQTQTSGTSVGYTVPAGDDRLLVLVDHSRLNASNTGAVTGVSGGGTWSAAFSHIRQSRSSLGVWVCPMGSSATSTAVTVTHTVDGAPSTKRLKLFTLTGVSQAAPVRATGTKLSGNSTTFALSTPISLDTPLSGVTGCLTMGFVSAETPVSLSVGGGATSLYADEAATTAAQGASYQADATDPSFTSGQNCNLAYAAVAFEPTTAGVVGSGTAEQAVNASSATTIGLTVTIGANQKLLDLPFLGRRKTDLTGTIQSAVLDPSGAALPLSVVGAHAHTTQPRTWGEVWRIHDDDGLPAGTWTLDVTFDAAPTGVLWARTYAGVDATNPAGAIQWVETDDESSTGAVISAPEGALAVAAALGLNAPGVTQDSAQTAVHAVQVLRDTGVLSASIALGERAVDADGQVALGFSWVQDPDPDTGETAYLAHSLLLAYAVLPAGAVPGAPVGLDSPWHNDEESAWVWTDDPTATSLSLEESADGSTGWGEVVSVALDDGAGGRVTSVSLGDRTPGSPRGYRAAFSNANGAGAYSPTLTFTYAPARPTTMTVASVGSGSVTVGSLGGGAYGTAGVATRLTVRRTSDGAEAARVELLADTPLPYTIGGISDGTYALYATNVDEHGESGPGPVRTFVVGSLPAAASRISRILFPFVRRASVRVMGSVTVSPDPASVRVGETVPLSAVVRDALGAVLEGRAVTWASSDETVAVVDATTGALTGRAVGSATITATSDGVSGTVSATVTAVPSADETGTILYLASDDAEGQLTAGEQALLDTIRTWGWDVTVSVAKGPDKFDLTLYRAAIVSQSANVNPGVTIWQDNWVDVDLPLLVLNWKMPTELGLAADFVGLDDTGTYTRSPLLLPGVEETAPGDLVFASAATRVVAFVGVAPNALTLLHAAGDHLSPAFCWHDRGEVRADGGVVAARVAFGSLGYAKDYGKLTVEGEQFLRNALKWVANDPGETIAPQYSVSRSYAPNATTLTATNTSTAPSGRTITSQSWVLRDETATTTVASGSAATFSRAALADGVYHLDLAVGDNLGNSRTKRNLFRAEKVTPIAAYRVTRTDGSPGSNLLHFEDASIDRGVTITSRVFQVHGDTSGDNVVWASDGSTTTATSAPLADGRYWHREIVTNADGQTDTTLLTRIEVPTPPTFELPRVATQPAEVHAVGEELYPYLMLYAAPGTTIESCVWDFDLDNPGTNSYGGDLATYPDALHPGRGVPGGKPRRAGTGFGRFSCDVVQSNGWSGHYEGVIRLEQESDWAQYQDYTRPALPTTTRDLYCDAGAATDGDGLTPTTPCKLLSTLKPKIQVGDAVHLAGDFSSQNYKLSLSNLGGGTASLGTVIQQWAGKAPAKLSTDNGTTLTITGGRYWAVQGIQFDQIHYDPILLKPILGDAIYASGGDHGYVFDCPMTGFNGFHPSFHADWWVDGCTFTAIGTDVTTTGGNGGYSLKMEVASRGTFVRNKVYDAGHNAIEAILSTSPAADLATSEAEYPGQALLTRDCRIAWNLVQNTWSGAYGPAGGEHMLLEHNVFVDTGTAEPLNGYPQVGSHGINLRQDRNEFRFNRVYGGLVGGIQVQTNYSAGVRQSLRRNRCYHNTYYNCGVVTFADAIHLTDDNGYSGGIFMEDNLWQNENYVDCHGRSNNLPKTYQLFLLLKTSDWSEKEVWQNQSSGTPRFGPNAAGNVVCHSNFKPRDSEVAAGGGQMLFISASVGGQAACFTPTDVEQLYPAWTGLTQNASVFLSTAIPTDWTDTTSLAPDPSSPEYASGVAIPGLDYSALGGRVPKGWDPAL